MTEQQQLWFDNLYKERKSTATTLMNSFAISNMWNSVVQNYSDQAHFIYELLQNANDARATKSSFELTAEGLYFTHNGDKYFWISNPENEKQDQKNNNLGDINAITAVAQSNKKDQATIGKFGIGFKSVFQYTETPHIYDPTFQFKICNFIVPVLLKNDLTDRKSEETVFYFPFDKKDKDLNGELKMPKERAFSDILKKLKQLVFPTLFLSILREIKWKAEGEHGEYSKGRIKKKVTRGITCELIELKQQIGLQHTQERIQLFSRYTKPDKLAYSVGFFLDEDDKLASRQFPAFCYFPTKETTNLNFIIHAPFLLNPSREGIHRSESHNVEMIDLLAQLSSDSLLILKDLKLIDDNIINIIPYKKSEFYEDSWSGFVLNDAPKYFSPFYTSIKEKFESEELLPTYDSYVQSDNAYWAQDNPILNLFSDEQLSLLRDRENAKWVFRSLVRNQTGKDHELREYIEDCTNDWFEMSDLLKKIDSNFIESQDQEWLHQFYEYLSINNSYWIDVKTKPIFLNTIGKAVPAFEQIGRDFHEILFLPSENFNDDEKTINPALLNREITREFITNFGIKRPSLKDEIFIRILPLYNEEGEIDTEPHFKLFFKYWKDEGRPTDFLNLIKDKDFIVYKSRENEDTFRGKAEEIYYPSPELEKYFEAIPSTKFVDLEFYEEYTESEGELQYFREFLFSLGVSWLPRNKMKETYGWQNESIMDEIGLNRGIKIYNRRNNYKTKIIDYFIDGLDEILKSPNLNVTISYYLWNTILPFYNKNFQAIFYYAVSTNDDARIEFPSNFIRKLKSSKWLFSINNQIVSPDSISIDELIKGYERNVEIERLLGLKSTVVLSATERIAQKFESEEDAELARQLLELHKSKMNTNPVTSGRNHPVRDDLTGDDIKEDSSSESENELQTEDLKIENVISDLEALQKAFNSKTNVSKIKQKSTGEKSEINLDDDEEFAKGVEDLKRKLEIKKNRDELRSDLKSNKKYSYDWFLSYLNLLTTYGDKQNDSSLKSISFQEIKPYTSDKKYFLLCGANTYISPEIENAEEFNITLVFGDGKNENVKVEGVSKKGQDLLAYCREALPDEVISRFSRVFKVEITFKPVLDLIERLLIKFENSQNVEKWEDINDALPPLNYIYGPPGTGKTTTLSDKINTILIIKPKAKILVLTPTNKAADVVCKKLSEINYNISSVRLGRPTDPELEEQEIYKDSLSERDMKSIHVVASTVHRLPYFLIDDAGLLFQYHWDYVIFDESSMTGLHYITFAIMALSKSNPDVQIFIAGDPKQIPPVIAVDDKELEEFDFQEENIYKMMGLESFDPAEQMIREMDDIINLDTQYRSLPQIGYLFSSLSYSGLLKHDRETNRKEAKPLPEKFRGLMNSNVTFIDIPLNKENSIYKVSKLFYSSYQTYCAILVAEIIKYFDTANVNENWTIGLIAPYKAQAILLNKLVTSYGISENVKVYADTVHGFQGDECDVVFFICNPNNYYFTGHEKCLLSKEYLYNVAISRAKDYLIILHPFSKITDNKFVNEIALAYKNKYGNTIIQSADNIEKVLFGKYKYIEKNCYISGHDSVNVFGISDMKYFIKSNDNAIDIQLGGIK